MKKIRKFLWRILGVDYYTFLKKQDYTLLKDDNFTELGVKTYDNGAKVWRWTKAPLKIGNYCSIANNVSFIVDEGHHNLSTITNFPLIPSFFKEQTYNNVSTEEFLENVKQKKGITIGNDVWIGLNSVILPGVIIGNGVTIAANSVVSKNVEDYTIVGGVPAELIKHKMSSIQKERMNNVKWWEWNEQKIKNNIDDFYLDIESFLEKYG